MYVTGGVGYRMGAGGWKAYKKRGMLWVSFGLVERGRDIWAGERRRREGEVAVCDIALERTRVNLGGM